MHVDMVPTRHAILNDSLNSEMETIDIQGYMYQGFYHHKRDPEIEDNLGLGANLGYSLAEKNYSVAFNAGFLSGKMIDNDGNRYQYSNLILRSSISLDQHDGDWHYQVLKIQVAASQGFGGYQRYLASGTAQRDRYNRAIAPGDWYYSLGIGSAMYHFNQKGHRSSLFFGFSRGTDFDSHGFRSDMFNLQMEHMRKCGIGLQLGGMLNARFPPGAETLYLGLSYDLWSRQKSSSLALP